MKRMLQRDGFHVSTTASGEQGLQIARELRPDVIALDVLMPGMDGWAVLHQLKSDPELAVTPVVMCTILQEREMGYALGATDYMTKPVDAERLRAVMRRLCCDTIAGPVLIVEDDAETRLMLRRIVEREGWEAVEAKNGRVAFERLETCSPSVILLDLMMPVMDGFEFLEQLRMDERWSDIPVIVVTAKDLSGDDRTRLSSGVQRIVNKRAYDGHELTRAIRHLTAGVARAGEQAGGRPEPPQSSTTPRGTDADGEDTCG